MPSEQANVLLATCVASFVPPFMSSSFLNLAIPAIGTEFGASAVMANWVITSHLIASAALLLPFGRLGDLTGRKRVFLAGMLIHVTFSLASGLATSAESLIVLRVFQGIGGLLTQHLGWRSILFTNVALGLVAAAVTALKIKHEWLGNRDGGFDVSGTAL